jgi:hypothetical protein
VFALHGGPPSIERLPAKGRRLRARERLRMRRRGWYFLLILPFVGTLVPPLYNHARPALAGLPFFYWYQLAWVVVTPVLLGIVVAFTGERDRV